MDASDCSFAYERLASLLREHRYGWILNEVETAIALGKIKAGRALDYDSDQQVPMPGEIEEQKVLLQPFVQTMSVEDVETYPSSERPQPRRPRRGRPIEIQKVDEFTPAEKLRMLLTATKRVFAGIPQMEDSAALILKRLRPEIKEIVLEDSQTDEPKPIDLLAGMERHSRAAVLADRLDRLKKMVD